MDKYYIYEIESGEIIQIGLCPKGSSYSVEEGFGFAIGDARPDKQKVVNGILVTK